MFSAAYRIYTAMLMISTVGLPAALSKMVAEATACGREHEVRRIVRVAGSIFVPVGALCSVALFFGAGTFAEWIKSADARLAVMAIAPSVLMVAILSVFRGYYQGRSNMVPTAVSQVIEAMGKLFVGLGLAYYAMGQGYSDPVVAAMTVLGVTLGEVVAAAYMLAQAAVTRRRATPVRILNDAVRPAGELAKVLLSLSIPITISSAVMSLTDLIDVALISARLQSPAVGMTAKAGDGDLRHLHRPGHQFLQPAADADHGAGGQRAADDCQRARGAEFYQSVQNAFHFAAADHDHHFAGRHRVPRSIRADPAAALPFGDGNRRPADGDFRLCRTRCGAGRDHKRYPAGVRAGLTCRWFRC